jgi:suppressor of tumorigenicity protein 13
MESKEKANEAKSNGHYDEAISHFSKAMEVGQVSAQLLANRAECLLKLKKPCAAISDCTAAIQLNPDSAKALRYIYIHENNLLLIIYYVFQKAIVR